MEKMTARFRRPKKEDKNDGSFKFAISLIVATLTVFYRLYLYVESNSIAPFIHLVLILVVLIMVTTLVSLGIFLFMKAMSLEVKNPIIREKLETSATSHYLIGFLCGVTYFISLLLFCATEAILNIVIFLLGVSKTTFLYKTISVLIYFFIPFSISAIIGKDFKEFINKISKGLCNISLKPLILCIVICFFVSAYALNGDIIIEMDDIYNKQNEQIPIEIKTTGLQYNDVVVNLSEVDFNNNLKIIDSIKIISTPDQNKVTSSEYLIGNSLGDGKFEYYINCTNLSEGYYELSVTTGRETVESGLMKTKTNSFYLVETKE